MSTHRNHDLLRLRPSIPVDTTEAGAVERFLHQTLRPILKLQNPILLAVVRQQVAKYHPAFDQLATSERQTLVENLLKQDSRLKHLLIGLVAGLFTTVEFAFFLEHEAEIRRRMTGLLVQRVQDQVDDLRTAA